MLKKWIFYTKKGISQTYYLILHLPVEPANLRA